ncbi:5-dehydro-2-deoxygluconokinase [Streptomyces sp. AM 3-1-1]|uniref:5-dehydro-2-deoxygluconokinase n=1 Tax=Streptomyces sp. AM 3-1-1 TaxID=3028711 RepID=UPI0023B9D455|nr:5-dehydro-2-deoxygluconokinase [Streptomyces sp. AM 3-1-1]WEH27502.1 5-dehydro-2-deoxygluconokinase [Streptomyces sp. AM 3-1-1]
MAAGQHPYEPPSEPSPASASSAGPHPHEAPAAPPRPLDVLTIGRTGVDLYPLESGVPLARVERFGKFLGGSATNVAVAAARLGLRAAVITRTGADPFGTFVRDELRALGVETSYVSEVPGLLTPVTFCELHPPDDFPLLFYRRPKAPDLEIRAGELDGKAIRGARVFWTTGTGLCAEPSRTATLGALAERHAAAPGALTVFDLDWRPMFWESRAEARPAYARALRHASVAVGNLTECEVATGATTPRACADALLEAGVTLAVVKQGPDGVLAAHRDGTVVEVAPLPVKVVNGLGAGDAFGGALCEGLLAGRPLAETIRFANAAGAIVAGRLECSTAMPFPHEVREALAAAG